MKCSKPSAALPHIPFLSRYTLLRVEKKLEKKSNFLHKLALVADGQFLVLKVNQQTIVIEKLTAYAKKLEWMDWKRKNHRKEY